MAGGPGVDGFIVVDKPSGPTSHDVVAAVRRATGMKKVGHAGTLDPMATGVVVVALGRATRLIRFVQDLPKEYLATARFGQATDTLDADGQIIESQPMEVGADEVRLAAAGFVGTIMQVPPMVSALKVDGRRLYELAREGKEIERQPRPVEIHEIEVREVGPPPFPEVVLRVRCGKGTYIRSLADDIAVTLGGRAHLVALRRTAVGHLDLASSVPMTELPEHWANAIMTPLQGLAGMAGATVDEETARAVSHGKALGIAPVAAGECFTVSDERQRLLAVYTSTGSGARPEVVLG
ncbi:MAG: tRNA pseudouridine(55) synthase TruB [Acidimicrobiia bacterium]